MQVYVYGHRKPPGPTGSTQQEVYYFEWCALYLLSLSTDKIHHTRHLITHATMVSYRWQQRVYLQKTWHRQSGSDFILLTDWRDALDLSDRWRTRTVTSATSEASHTSERWRWCMSIITEVCGSTTSPVQKYIEGFIPGQQCVISSSYSGLYLEKTCLQSSCLPSWPQELNLSPASPSTYSPADYFCPLFSFLPALRRIGGCSFSGRFWPLTRPACTDFPRSLLCSAWIFAP